MKLCHLPFLVHYDDVQGIVDDDNEDDEDVNDYKKEMFTLDGVNWHNIDAKAVRSLFKAILEKNADHTLSMLVMFPYVVGDVADGMPTGSSTISSCYRGNFSGLNKGSIKNLGNSVERASRSDLDVVEKLVEYDVWTYEGYKQCAVWLGVDGEDIVEEGAFSLELIAKLITVFQEKHKLRFAPVEGLHRAVCYASYITRNNLATTLWKGSSGLSAYDIDAEICAKELMLSVLDGDGKTMKILPMFIFIISY